MKIIQTQIKMEEDDEVMVSDIHGYVDQYLTIDYGDVLVHMGKDQGLKLLESLKRVFKVQ